jgi:CheY-like chemotaxis protein
MANQMSLLGKRIFIVEDNASNSTIMKVLLHAAGAIVYNDRYAINTVARIHEAGKIDLIIMDLMLSKGQSGYDVIDEIRKDPELARIPAVVVSASDPELEMNRARDKGFQGYIPKPINNSTFAKLIASVINGQPVWGDDFNQNEYEHF